MPPIGKLMGNVDFSSLFINLSRDKGPFDSLAAAKAAGPPRSTTGVFMNTVLDFVIVAFAIFVMIKAINMAKRRRKRSPRRLLRPRARRAAYGDPRPAQEPVLSPCSWLPLDGSIVAVVREFLRTTEVDHVGVQKGHRSGALVGLVFVLMSGCGSKVSKSNYDKIDNGMTLSQCGEDPRHGYEKAGVGGA